MEELSKETQQALKILEDVKSMIREREKQYGNTWVAYGLDGNWSHLHEKILRIKHQIDQQLPKEASVDTLYDLIVWTTFCIVCLFDNLDTTREKLDPEKFKLKYTPRELYGGTEELSTDDMFVLTEKFHNALLQNYKNRQPIPYPMVDAYIKSLELLREKCK